MLILKGSKLPFVPNTKMPMLVKKEKEKEKWKLHFDGKQNLPEIDTIPLSKVYCGILNTLIYLHSPVLRVYPILGIYCQLGFGWMLKFLQPCTSSFV